MPYIPANEVRAPRANWTLVQVLIDHGQSDHVEVCWSLAIGEWDKKRRLAMRWNGTEERPAGNPQSRGIATWFVLPSEFHDAIVGTLAPDMQSLAKQLLK